MMIQKPDNPVLAALNFFIGLAVVLLFVLIVPWKLPLLSLVFVLLGLCSVVGGAGLLFRPALSRTLLKISAWAGIGAGSVIILLSLTAMSYLSGVYAGMGKTASGLFLFVILFIALLLYLLPGLQLFHLRRTGKQ